MAAIEERRRKSNGKASYRVKIRIKGAPALSASFERRTDAVKWAEKQQSAIRDGRDFPTAEAKRHTVAELIDRYVADVLPHKPHDKRNRAAQLSWWKSEIGTLRLTEVTRSVIAAKRDQLLASSVRRQREDAPEKKKSPATVRRYLAALSHALSIAVKEWGWLEDNPVLKISKPAESPGRTRCLDKEQLKLLIEACAASKNPHLHIVTVLAVSTGMRQGEILSLRRRQVDCKAGRITLITTKNGDPRVVPLAGKALGLMKERLDGQGVPDELLFPGRNPDQPTELAVPWATVLRKAGITDFRFHDLRHCAATYLLEAGATTLQVAGVLGHRTLQMVKRYAHVRDPHAAALISGMNERIFSEEKE